MLENNLSRDYLQPRFTTILAPCLLLVVLATTFYCGVMQGGYHDYAQFFGISLCVLALAVAYWVMPHNFSVGFLVSTLAFVTNWRIAAMMDIWPIMWASAACAVFYVIMFFDCMRNDWVKESSHSWFGALEWQMTSVRIYFGYDMVGHFTEKLFAGSASLHHMGEIFAGFGVPAPEPFVIVGGLCELGIAIGIGAGFLTRLAAVGAALYFMVANQYGAHFDNGFTWANGPDGGWEYPLLMAVFYLSFALCGGGRVSIDGWLISRGLMPRLLLPLCVSKTKRTVPLPVIPPATH